MQLPLNCPEIIALQDFLEERGYNRADAISTAAAWNKQVKDGKTAIIDGDGEVIGWEDLSGSLGWSEAFPEMDD